MMGFYRAAKLITLGQKDHIKYQLDAEKCLYFNSAIDRHSAAL